MPTVKRRLSFAGRPILTTALRFETSARTNCALAYTEVQRRATMAIGGSFRWEAAVGCDTGCDTLPTSRTFTLQNTGRNEMPRLADC